LYFKYFLSTKLSFDYSDGEEKASLSAFDITNNHLYNNPGLMTSIWYDWKVNKNLFLHSGIDYAYDMNFMSSVPSFRKIGVSLGVIIKLGN